MTVQPDVVERAEAFVDDEYRRAGRSDSEIAHPRQVGCLLAELGCEPHVVATGFLHDVLEDTDATEDDVRAGFGPRVAELVTALTEDPGVGEYGPRKAALRASVAAGGHTAMVVFAADKLARMRTADRTGAAIEPRKLEHYRRTLELLRRHGIRTPHVDELDRRLRQRRGPAAVAPAERRP